MKSKAHQTGLTLIEIMIALLIGAFLLGGVMQIFINSRQTYRMQENLSRLQENGRFAMEFLAKDIRMAGYWGCLQSIAGGGNVDIVDPGGQVILRGAFTQPVPPAINIAGVSCGDTIDATAAYYTDASSTVRYRLNNNVLQRTDPAGNFQDLIEGVENAQVFYGVDTDTDNTPNYYVPANAVWNAAGGLVVAGAKVISIRITLTVRSIDGNLIPATAARPDGRITRNFTTTIALRNRLL